MQEQPSEVVIRFAAEIGADIFLPFEEQRLKIEALLREDLEPREGFVASYQLQTDGITKTMVCARCGSRADRRFSGPLITVQAVAALEEVGEPRR